MDLSTWSLLQTFHRGADIRAEVRETEHARAQAQHWLNQYNQLVDDFNAVQKAGREVLARADQLELLVRERDHQLQSKDARIAELEAALRRCGSFDSYL